MREIPSARLPIIKRAAWSAGLKALQCFLLSLIRRVMHCRSRYNQDSNSSSQKPLTLSEPRQAHGLHLLSCAVCFSHSCKARGWRWLLRWAGEEPEGCTTGRSGHPTGPWRDRSCGGIPLHPRLDLSADLTGRVLRRVHVDVGVARLYRLDQARQVALLDVAPRDDVRGADRPRHRA